MSRPAARTPGEFVALALLVFFALFRLIFVLIGVLVPDKATGVLAVQNGFLALGRLVGSLGAMAMIWWRNRVRPAKATVGAGHDALDDRRDPVRVRHLHGVHARRQNDSDRTWATASPCA